MQSQLRPAGEIHLGIGQPAVLMLQGGDVPSTSSGLWAAPVDMGTSAHRGQCSGREPLLLPMGTSACLMSHTTWPSSITISSFHAFSWVFFPTWVSAMSYLQIYTIFTALCRKLKWLLLGCCMTFYFKFMLLPSMFLDDALLYPPNYLYCWCPWASNYLMLKNSETFLLWICPFVFLILSCFWLPPKTCGKGASSFKYALKYFLIY